MRESISLTLKRHTISRIAIGPKNATSRPMTLKIELAPANLERAVCSRGTKISFSEKELMLIAVFGVTVGAVFPFGSHDVGAHCCAGGELGLAGEEGVFDCFDAEVESLRGKRIGDEGAEEFGGNHCCLSMIGSDI